MRRKTIIQTIMIVGCLVLLTANHSGGAEADYSSDAVRIPIQTALMKIDAGAWIVDVRRSEKYNTVRIPGSVNIPLFSLKRQTYLRGKTIVLVDEGYSSIELQRICLDLRAEGFDAWILRDGLHAWALHGGELVGDKAVVKDFQNMSPSDYFRDRNRKDLMLVDISSEKTRLSSETFPNVVHAPHIDSHGIRSVSFCGATDCSGNLTAFLNPTVVFCSKDGSGYEKVKKLADNARISNVYFLADGWQACERFQENHVRQDRPRKERLKTIGKCRACAASAATSP